MIWSMADLATAKRLRNRITSPFTTRVGTTVGRGLEEAMRERFRQQAKEEELVVHPHDIVVEIEEPILATDLVAPAFSYSMIVARWMPVGRPLLFKGMGEPADSLFAGSTTINEGWTPDFNDTLLLEVVVGGLGASRQGIEMILTGWSEEERAWVYGPKPGVSQESGNMAGNGGITISFPLVG